MWPASANSAVNETSDLELFLKSWLDYFVRYRNELKVSWSTPPKSKYTHSATNISQIFVIVCYHFVQLDQQNGLSSPEVLRQCFCFYRLRSNIYHFLVYQMFFQLFQIFALVSLDFYLHRLLIEIFRNLASFTHPLYSNVPLTSAANHSLLRNKLFFV